MAEFKFYGNWEDSYGFLEDLIKLNRFSFVVAMGYQTDEIYQFTSLTNDIKAFLKQHRVVYLWSEEYSRFPPQLKPRNSSGYRWLDSWGGPYLELFLPYQEERNGMTELVWGMLHYLPYYVYPGTNIAYKPPDKLKGAYKETQKILCKSMKRHYTQISFYTPKGDYKTQVLTFWIGLNALKLIEEGKGMISNRYKKSNLVKTRRELELLSKK